ncbi:MAG: hypothetical protein KGM16_11155 [Bacteroidota bacterium]|nr:hypothetical protein [Bacteroidota bacterium]
MLQIQAIKININTTTGLFGRTMSFTKGLNIIRANNTSGKSSLFGAIVYGLGFEELLGSKNEKALQSVFKSLVKEFIDNNRDQFKESTVVQSEILLEITNGMKSITTRRFIVNEKIKPQAIEVFYGKLISEPEQPLERASMYLHDKGGATNEEIGFHKFLENFMGIKLPEIVNQEGKRVKLYLPLISAAHFIEQKSGWSDLFASIPYYGIRDTDSKVFEFILDFDVFESATKRQEIQNRMKEIEAKWEKVLEKIESILSRGGGEIVGIPDKPEILSNDIRPYARFYRGDKQYMLNQLISDTSEELNLVLAELKEPINKDSERIVELLNRTKEETERYEILYESLSSETSQERERLHQYTNQLKNVLEDLKKNKDEEKLQKLGLEANLKVANKVCPTCNQTINDSLLSSHIHFTPMRIDENISYLHAQQKMIEAFINNLKEVIIDKETKLSSLENAIHRNRQKIRALNKDLTSDDRLPSEEKIERKIVLERELGFLYRLRIEIEDLIIQIYALSEEYKKTKSEGSQNNREYHSSSDLAKLSIFENNFKSMLSKFDFTSKIVEIIKISQEKYKPVYEIRHENGLMRQVDIRFESSASDFIRSEWAYYTSLMKTSIAVSGNHFLTLLFDEPQQQSASTQSFKAFLKELENFKEAQVIVLASFQNSKKDFIEATEDLTNVNIIDLAEDDELMINRVGEGKV